MNSYPSMTSMSDVITVKRIEMEEIQRKKRYGFTPRLVSWNVSAERPSTYFPNIERSFIMDMGYNPGIAYRKKRHANSVNREGFWPPQSQESDSDETMNDLLSDINDSDPVLSDPLQNPEFFINPPVRLLSREYKHPLSMYEEEQTSSYSRSAPISLPPIKNPIIPNHYRRSRPLGRYIYLERPALAGREWGNDLLQARMTRLISVRTNILQSAHLKYAVMYITASYQPLDFVDWCKSNQPLMNETVAGDDVHSDLNIT